MRLPGEPLQTPTSPSSHAVHSSDPATHPPNQMLLFRIRNLLCTPRMPSHPPFRACDAPSGPSAYVWRFRLELLHLFIKPEAAQQCGNLKGDGEARGHCVTLRIKQPRFCLRRMDCMVRPRCALWGALVFTDKRAPTPIHHVGSSLREFWDPAAAFWQRDNTCRKHSVSGWTGGQPMSNARLAGFCGSNNGRKDTRRSNPDPGMFGMPARQFSLHFLVSDLAHPQGAP